MCKARKGVKDLPILAQSCLGKSGCCEEKSKPLVTRDAGGASRASLSRASRSNDPWQHLVSPIRFANGRT